MYSAEGTMVEIRSLVHLIQGTIIKCSRNHPVTNHTMWIMLHSLLKKGNTLQFYMEVQGNNLINIQKIMNATN